MGNDFLKSRGVPPPLISLRGVMEVHTPWNCLWLQINLYILLSAHTLHSTLCSEVFTFYTLLIWLFTFCKSNLILYYLHSTLSISVFTFYIITLHFTFWKSNFILCYLRSTLCSEVFTFYITNLTLYILQIKLNTLPSTLSLFPFLHSTL